MVSNDERDGWSRKKRETGQLESREAEVWRESLLTDESCKEAEHEKVKERVRRDNLPPLVSLLEGVAERTEGRNRAVSVRVSEKRRRLDANSHGRSDLLVGSEPDWRRRERRRRRSACGSRRTERLDFEPGLERRDWKLTEHDRMDPIEVGDEQRYRKDDEEDVACDD